IEEAQDGVALEAFCHHVHPVLVPPEALERRLGVEGRGSPVGRIARLPGFGEEEGVVREGCAEGGAEGGEVADGAAHFRRDRVEEDSHRLRVLFWTNRSIFTASCFGVITVR